MAGFTNKGKAKLLRNFFQSETPPTNLYVYLVTSATAPTADTNTLGQLTEISETGKEFSLSLNTTDFDTSVSDSEDDTNDKGVMKIKDCTFAGPVTNARYAILVDDNGTEGSREVYCYWDLGSNRSVSSGQTLTLQDLEMNLLEP
tara:strand:+ start:609 stop:1043 length:435 start_codon:yes stop_codon:yes gene_type:complete